MRIVLRERADYHEPMPRKQQRKPTEREFMIIRLRASGQFVGVVKAIDAEAAKKTALSQFSSPPRRPHHRSA
jgi:hypothetical protein